MYLSFDSTYSETSPASSKPTRVASFGHVEEIMYDDGSSLASTKSDIESDNLDETLATRRTSDESQFSDNVTKYSFDCDSDDGDVSRIFATADKRRLKRSVTANVGASPNRCDLKQMASSKIWQRRQSFSDGQERYGNGGNPSATVRLLTNNS
eukprot:CAMPEP_0169289710 /NCGR_PEP_ID=MMETSP1016-20121227/61303_1 /TAXON_ID=342587 /ORGANISM="Karlodinium micrum, Strain CCMP2283" /LENGTH=152 /DNA_ID=CAMNT_0009380155 /DNA_START=50 /DNA_END=508 /DNA_ORIENTATION=-